MTRSELARINKMIAAAVASAKVAAPAVTETAPKARKVAAPAVSELPVGTLTFKNTGPTRKGDKFAYTLKTANGFVGSLYFAANRPSITVTVA